ncbi:MAG TPA: ribonuclease Z [Mycobacteriales bacterium]|nr:ribonuclease Z [Mycobacteriales bacterium]
MTLQVVFLGTGSPLPDPNRAGPATLVRAGTAMFLVDCGRGVLMRAAAAGATAGNITALLLTHLHSDHITDLNDVITTRWVTSFEPSPLRVVGPPGTRDVVDGILASLSHDIGYRLAHHADLNWPPPVEVVELTEGTVHDAGGVRVVAAPTDHRPVAPSVGYRIEGDGKAVVVSGDTVPCAGLDSLCVGADTLVSTVIRADVLRASGVARLIDVCDYHSSVEQAADTAQRAGLQTLALTHYVPPPAPGALDEWRALAAAVFSGTVLTPNDLDTHDL